MIKRIRIILVGVAFLFSACDENSQKTSSPSVLTTRINIRHSDSVSIKDVFSKVELVPLETSKGVILKNADKVILQPNRCYVLDKKACAVFVFSGDGRYKYKLQKSAGTIAEYIRLSDFDINRFTKNVELLSPNGQVLVYDTLGTFHDSFKPNQIRSAQFFKALTKDTLVFYTAFEPNRIFYYSRKLQKVVGVANKVPAYLSRTPLNLTNSPFIEFGSKVYMFESFSNNVYELTNDGLRVSYSWDFGSDNFDFRKLPDDKPGEFYRNYFMQNDKEAFDFLYNLETPERIYTSLIFKRTGKNIIFFKSSKSYKVFNLFSEGVGYPALSAFDHGVFASINPNHLNVVVKPTFLNDTNQRILKNIKVTDNPVIVKYYK